MLLFKHYNHHLIWLLKLLQYWACGFFIFISIIIYFVRLYQLRVSINNIPNKSLYIPFENDFANKAIFHYIDDKLKYCHEIKFKSGPLQNAMYIINHPGLSPPEYIMKRNAQCLTNMNRNVFPIPSKVMGISLIKSMKVLIVVVVELLAKERYYHLIFIMKM